MKRLALTVGLAFASATVAAAEFRTLELIRDEGRFRVESDVYLEAPPGGVYRALIDYDIFESFSSVFV